MAEIQRTNITKEWAKLIANMRYEDLPCEVVRAVKISLLDIIGAILAGTASPVSEKVMKLLKAWGGRQESTLAGEETKIPAMNAGLANTVCGVAWENPALHRQTFRGHRKSNHHLGGPRAFFRMPESTQVIFLID